MQFYLSLNYCYLADCEYTYSTNLKFSGTWECHGSLCRL